MHTKFHQNPSSGSGEEVENVNCLTDVQTTDAGQRMITIGHWCAQKHCEAFHATLIVSVHLSTEARDYMQKLTGRPLPLLNLEGMSNRILKLKKLIASRYL